MEYQFVGGGNMGYALAAALIQQRICPASEILVTDPTPEARLRAEQLGCATSDGVRRSDARVVVLAVKPQQAPEVLRALAGRRDERQAVVSIMAGIRLATIREITGYSAVVRVMPNTPAQVGQGMNVYFAAPGVTAEQLVAVEALLTAAGKVLRVETEDLIDAATAVSGSGPAYVFYLAEHWMQAAIGMGFADAQAALLVEQTIRGAAELWSKSGVSPATLRQQVTSKGGTTAAAIESMDRDGVGAAIELGVRRAYERAKELGR